MLKDVVLECCKLYGEADKELCLIFDQLNTEGKPDQAFVGRGAALSMKTVTDVPPTKGDKGYLDVVGLGCDLFLSKARELRTLIGVAADCVDTAKVTEWTSRWTYSRVKLRKPNPYMKAFIASMGAAWELRVSVLGISGICDVHILTLLDTCIR